MTDAELIADLAAIATEEDFSKECGEVVDRWTRRGVGVEAVVPVLRFIEGHPDIDLGMPGPLIHFVEQFHGRGYQERLLESLARRPTWATAWLLNRIINAESDSVCRERLVALMRRAGTHSASDARTRELIGHFLIRLAPADG